MADDTSAQVTLDAASVAKIEATLRGALASASAANIGTGGVGGETTAPDAAVTLDPATVARFTEHLRSGLVNAAAANIGNHQDVNESTAKIR